MPLTQQIAGLQLATTISKMALTTLHQLRHSMTTDLILASSSPYRRQLLSRLSLDFRCLAPDIDETPLEDERGEQLVERLSLAKTQAILSFNQEAIVIGSDQVATLDHQILTKPYTVTNACAQLAACSGREVIFLTGLCVASQQQHYFYLHPTRVNFRSLTSRQIQDYVTREQPLDCAGSFKCEGLGISLFTSIHSDDPTGLIGLPLIALTTLLGHFGVHPLAGSFPRIT